MGPWGPPPELRLLVWWRWGAREAPAGEGRDLRLVVGGKAALTEEGRGEGRDGDPGRRRTNPASGDGRWTEVDGGGEE